MSERDGFSCRLQSYPNDDPTEVKSGTLPVPDQDRAVRFYTEVRGCELSTDVEEWPGAWRVRNGLVYLQDMV